MTTPSTAAGAEEGRLLEAARGGDQGAFTTLAERYRGELHAHCYRMLGSIHDAEEALQEAMLRAWRGLPKFAGRSSLRSWLYRIATNTCLDQIGRRPKRVLPVDYGPPTDPHDGPIEPLVDSTWIGPYPDEAVGIGDGYASPEARYEMRESVELAFIAALQTLPPNQRAALILREVLGFSAKETAEALDTSVASINSALQRARASVDSRTPERSQQQTLRELGDEGVRQTVESYIDAWERGDVEAVVGMLTEDAAFTMPPLRSWFRGRDEIAVFLAGSPMSGRWQWRTRRLRANGQEAIAFYTWDPETERYLRFALNVLTLTDDGISEVDAFLTRETQDPSPEAIQSMPERAFDPRRLDAAFERFGLPETLPR
jgi:RNA polymerase sigma-70 factor (ECF subfamily)